MVANHERAEQVERELWHEFLIRQQGEQLGALQGRRLGEQENAERAVFHPGPISRKQLASDAWYEAVAQAHVEAAAQVRARRMPRADLFAESFVRGFIRAYLGTSRTASPGTAARK